VRCAAFHRSPLGAAQRLAHQMPPGVDHLTTPGSPPRSRRRRRNASTRPPTTAAANSKPQAVRCSRLLGSQATLGTSSGNQPPWPTPRTELAPSAPAAPRLPARAAAGVKQARTPRQFNTDSGAAANRIARSGRRTLPSRYWVPAWTHSRRPPRTAVPRATGRTCEGGSVLRNLKSASGGRANAGRGTGQISARSGSGRPTARIRRTAERNQTFSRRPDSFPAAQRLGTISMRPRFSGR
jgi:hypothetical protein